MKSWIIMTKLQPWLTILLTIPNYPWIITVPWITQRGYPRFCVHWCTHLQNLNTSVASFPHRDIHYQSYDIETKLYKITYTQFFIKKFICCRNLSCSKIDYTVIYHKYNYHDIFFPHLSWYRIYHFRCFIINTEPRDHRCKQINT